MTVKEALDSDGHGGRSVVETMTNVGEKTRIYVGGLGDTVTEDDLRKTFLALGKIEAIDIVRTKGRSLAYLDFIPSSDKSLSKLFSTYNGCMWKGGRLRLEKAKEHYLLRLKRGWQEEVECASDASESNTNASENMPSFEKPKKSASFDKMQLQIFFPKLRKVKSVPWSGTGKHKYSFQRIPVPTLPTHFCDCPEHYIPPPPRTKERTFSDIETESGGINEEELNIMNSVMKKLLEREDLPETAGKESNLPSERVNSDGSVDDLPADDSEEDHMTDEDNLIINVVAGENDMRQSLEAVMANQEPVSDKSQTSKDKLPQNMHDSQKKTLLPHKKKRKLSESEESGENHRTSSDLHLTTSEDGASEVKLSSQQLKSNSSWKQKSGWRSLIGQRGNNPFSISDIIPNVTLQKEDEHETSDLDVPSIMDEKEEPKTADLDVPSIMDKKEESETTVDLDMAPITDVKKQNFEKHGNVENESCQSKDPEKHTEAPPAKVKEVSNKVARGAAWLAKSSWTQLVGTTINSPFSISQVLPGLTFEKQDQLQHNTITVVKSRESMEGTLNPDIREAKDSSDARVIAKKDLVTLPLASNVTPLPKHDLNPPGTRMEQKPIEEKLMKNSEVSPSSNEKAQPSKSLGDFKFSDTCPFMRTDTSMKQWRKRKGTQNNASKKKKKRVICSRYLKPKSLRVVHILCTWCMTL